MESTSLNERHWRQFPNLGKLLTDLRLRDYHHGAMRSACATQIDDLAELLRIAAAVSNSSTQIFAQCAWRSGEEPGAYCKRVGEIRQEAERLRSCVEHLSSSLITDAVEGIREIEMGLHLAARNSLEHSHEQHTITDGD